LGLCEFLSAFGEAQGEEAEGRVRRVYDDPKTPFERVLEHPKVSEVLKAELQRRYEGLNPADLRRKILRLQQELFRLATPLRGITYE